MRLDNHIALRFLTDESLIWEIIETTHPDWLKSDEDEEIGDKVKSLYKVLCPQKDKAYFVTNTVLDKLDMLKVTKRKLEIAVQTNFGLTGFKEAYDWTVFNVLKQYSKRTFVFPNNSLLRMVVSDEIIHFVHLSWVKKPESGIEDYGTALWIMFYVNRNTGEQCDHFNHSDVKNIEEFVYKLLCFVFLSENEEILLAPGSKHGTKKTGKIINTLTVPLTVINSKWNITSVRTEGFQVRGHFAIRWSGEGRSVAKMVFIQPFEKHGYIRKAAIDSIN